MYKKPANNLNVAEINLMWHGCVHVQPKNMRTLQEGIVFRCQIVKVQGDFVEGSGELPVVKTFLAIWAVGFIVFGVYKQNFLAVGPNCELRENHVLFLVLIELE